MSEGHSDGHVEAAVAGEAGEQHVGEAELRRRAPGADVGEPAHAPLLVGEHLDDAADAAHGVEVAEVGQGGPQVALAAPGG